MTEIRTFNEYQSMAAYTAIYPGRGKTYKVQEGDHTIEIPLGLMYVGLGLGEAGEVQGKIKKILRDNGGVVTGEVRMAIAKEIGDELWYLSQIATELQLFLEDIASENIAKLLDRKARGVLQGSGDDR